jgi:hypothetical protein
MPLFTGIPLQTQAGPPWWASKGGFRTSTSTTVSSSEHPAYSDNVPTNSSPLPTSVQSFSGPIPTQTSNNDESGGGPLSQHDEGHPNKVMPAVAGVAVVAMLVIIGVFVFFCLRKRKRRSQAVAQQAKAQEMKARGQHSMLANVGASSTFPQYAAPPIHPPPAGLTTPPPVILGPIVPGSNGAYYTGIDTSDVVSLNDRTVVDRTGLGNPFADGDSLNEEPPPPYRPRSLAPMSRDTSFRVAPPSFTTSQTHLIGGQERSPFADPEDDDAISDISGPTRRDHDRMSVVSDMSYQHEPVVVRPTV